MSSVHKLEFLMVSWLVGFALLSFGAEGAPSKSHPKKGNSQHREEVDASSYRLLVDSQFKSSGSPIQSINNDSISPWTYTFTHDDDLYPPSISEAQCSLTGCLIDGKEDQNYQSKPVYTQIMVLRRVLVEQPPYIFQLEHKTIAVGCTCVRHHVVQM